MSDRLSPDLLNNASGTLEMRPVLQTRQSRPAAPLTDTNAGKSRPRTRRQMRLAYLTTQYPKVSHTFIRRELMELERRGHHVLRLAIRPADSAIVDPADLAENERTLHCLSQPWYRLAMALLTTGVTRPYALIRTALMTLRMGRSSERGYLRHLAYLVEATFLLGQLQHEQIEHVHVHFGTNALSVARLVRCLGGPPYSFTVHGPDEFDSPRSSGLALKQADAAFVVAISDYCSAQLRRWADPKHWSKIHVVRCGLGDHFLSDSGKTIDSGSQTFVCVGRLCPQKGQLLLIDALAQLRREGVNANLVLAGDGEMRREIEARIAQLGLGDQVHITGWIGEKQVREHILNSRAMVLPSFAEGLPVVIMEAMALRRPVISTYVAGIPELVRHGETGWLVPAGNVEELTQAMRDALSAPLEQLDCMGQAGRDRAVRLHDSSVEAGRLEELLLAPEKANAPQGK